jgi:hypothetical protein
MKNTTRYDCLDVVEVIFSSCRKTMLLKNGTLLAVFRNNREAEKLKKILRLLTESKIPLERLDEKFFSILSVYICEEYKINYTLLKKEVERCVL